MCIDSLYILNLVINKKIKILIKESDFMGFYEEISKYYDYIFPTGKPQIGFISKTVGNPPKELLDIACGTGGYSIELANLGYKVTAVDLDHKMVEALKAKIVNENLAINIFQGDMLELKDKVIKQYDLAFCIGNSIVHLDGEKEIEKFFMDMKGILKENGKLIIQIINYDRVLLKQITSLPTIENQEVGLEFQRIYRYDEKINKVLFKTVLKVEGNEIENEIPLYPLLAQDMEKLLKKSGFNEIKLYGDFKESEFSKEDSYALVVVAS
jgi:glycine/sarcosine N-methyltransferase